MHGNGARGSSDYGATRPAPALRWVTDPLHQWPSMSWPVRRCCSFPPPSDRPSTPASRSAHIDVQATQRAAGQARRFTRSVLTLWTTEDTDIGATQAGFISVTPMRFDVTAYEAMGGIVSQLSALGLVRP